MANALHCLLHELVSELDCLDGLQNIRLRQVVENAQNVLFCAHLSAVVDKRAQQRHDLIARQVDLQFLLVQQQTLQSTAEPSHFGQIVGQKRVGDELKHSSVVRENRRVSAINEQVEDVQFVAVLLGEDEVLELRQHRLRISFVRFDS